MVTVVGTVIEEPRLTYNRKRRAVLTFHVNVEPFNQSVKIVVRGEKAVAWSSVLHPGADIRLDGKVRTVTFLRAETLSPAVERWRTRRPSAPGADATAATHSRVGS